ncbi:MAG: ZIP family metal transporter [Nitrospinota bacterium]|nr:ZIP family metal transporter [Nitrospinota bacterium]
MKNNLNIFFVYLAAIFAISMSGAFIPLIRKWSKDTFRLIISFGAGILFGACFFHMLPAITPSLGGNVGIPIIIGFFIIYIMEKFIMVHSCEEDVCDFHTIGVSAFLGISFHSLLDGMSIGAGFIAEDIVFIVFLAIVIHKFPSALSLTGILIEGGYKKKKIIQLAVIFALTTPVGALLSFFILKNLNEVIIAWAIGISAGTFLCIATSDLLPLVHQQNKKKHLNLLSLITGLLIMWFGKYFLHI